MFGSPDQLAVATSDGVGAFRIAGLVSGTYSVAARGRDGGIAIVDRVDAGATGISITLDPASSIDGTLLGFANMPSVIATPMHGVVGAFELDRDGTHFHGGGLSAGPYVVTANTGLGETAAVSVTVVAGRATTIELASHGSGVLDLHVVDFTSHAGIAGQRCMVLGRAGPLLGTMYTQADDGLRTDVAGNVTLDPASAGDVTVICGGPTGGGRRLITLATKQRMAVDVPVVQGASPRDFGIDLDEVNVVRALTNGSAGERAGLRIGDRIAAVGGADVSQLSPPNLFRLIEQHRGGSSVPLSLARDGQLVVASLIVPN
jgi:hypothetical protein